MATDPRRRTMGPESKTAGPLSSKAASTKAAGGPQAGPADPSSKPAASASGTCDTRLINRLLEVIEEDIIPLTRAAVRQGNKIFGAAILLKADLSLVAAAANNETENPLWHGEVHALKKFYELPKSKRPNTGDLLFLATHEPCTLCLSAITWTGFDNFYYLFSHEDSRDSFNIPHDLKILQEVFRCGGGGYARENCYWKSYHLKKLINACDDKTKRDFLARMQRLEGVYGELSDIYQKNKDKVDMPLK